MRNNLVIIEGTEFIYTKNFSGDPTRDKYGSSTRKANIVIPDIDLARQLIDEGFNVKLTKPSEGEEEGFVPKYFVSIILKYDSKWPPRVYHITPAGKTVLLDADSVGSIDFMWIENVNVVLNKYEGRNGKSLYIRSMEVFQMVDDDPIAARHANMMNGIEDEAISFN